LACDHFLHVSSTYPSLADTGVSSRTVRRATATMRTLGLLLWRCRIVRSGVCVDQTSNAYVLVPASDAIASIPVSKKEEKLKASLFVGHAGRRLDSGDLPPLSLAAIAAQRLTALRLGHYGVRVPS
jgi:hypothetical protein